VVEFSWTLVFLILLLLAIIFMWRQVSTVLIFLFLGFIFMSAIKPSVDWLVSKKVSKGWAVAISYILFVVVFFGLFSIVIIPFTNQLSDLVVALPNWITNTIEDLKSIKVISQVLTTPNISSMLTDFLKSIPTADSIKNVTDVLSGFLSTTTLVFTSLVFSMYLVLEYDSLLEFGLIRIPSDQKRQRVKKLFVDVQKKLGRWILGQATISTIAGVVAGVILTVLKVPFALPLAVFVALMNSVPNIGATIAMIPIAIVALITAGPISAIIVLVCLIFYQQIENNFISPKIMGNAVGIRPVLVMLGVVISLLLFGVLGALVAVPLMVIGKIIYEFYIDLQKLKAKGIV
jgi:predicted PurR-regulated permease PerM